MQRQVETWIVNVRDVLARVHAHDAAKKGRGGGGGKVVVVVGGGGGGWAAVENESQGAADLDTSSRKEGIIPMPSEGDSTTTTSLAISSWPFQEQVPIELATVKTLSAVSKLKITADKQRGIRGKKKKQTATATVTKPTKPHVHELLWLVDKGVGLPVNVYDVNVHLLNLVHTAQVWQSECRASLQEHEQTCQATCKQLLESLASKMQAQAKLAQAMVESLRFDTRPSFSSSSSNRATAEGSTATTEVMLAAPPSTTLSILPVQTAEQIMVKTSGGSIQEAIEVAEREKCALKKILSRFGGSSVSKCLSDENSEPLKKILIQPPPAEETTTTTGTECGYPSQPPAALTRLQEQSSDLSVATVEELELQKLLDIDRWCFQLGTFLTKVSVPDPCSVAAAFGGDEALLLAVVVVAGDASAPPPSPPPSLQQRRAAGGGTVSPPPPRLVREEVSKLEDLVISGVRIFGDVEAASTDESPFETSLFETLATKQQQRAAADEKGKQQRKSARKSFPGEAKDKTAAFEATTTTTATSKDKHATKKVTSESDDEDAPSGEGESDVTSDDDPEDDIFQQTLLTCVDDVEVQGAHIDPLKDCLRQLKGLLLRTKAWQDSVSTLFRWGGGEGEEGGGHAAAAASSGGGGRTTKPSLPELETALAVQASLLVDTQETHRLLNIAEGAVRWLEKASEAFKYYVDRQWHKRWVLEDLQQLSDGYLKHDEGGGGGGGVDVELVTHVHISSAVAKVFFFLAFVTGIFLSFFLSLPVLYFFLSYRYFFFFLIGVFLSFLPVFFYPSFYQGQRVAGEARQERLGQAGRRGCLAR
jgi:hypothetical protein